MRENREALGGRLPLLLTIDEVAAELGMNRATVYTRLVTPGILPAVRIGRSRRVAQRDLLEFLERLRREAGAGDDTPAA